MSACVCIVCFVLSQDVGTMEGRKRRNRDATPLGTVAGSERCELTRVRNGYFRKTANEQNYKRQEKRVRLEESRFACRHDWKRFMLGAISFKNIKPMRIAFVCRSRITRNALVHLDPFYKRVVVVAEGSLGFWNVLLQEAKCLGIKCHITTWRPQRARGVLRDVAGSDDGGFCRSRYTKTLDKPGEIAKVKDTDNCVVCVCVWKTQATCYATGGKQRNKGHTNRSLEAVAPPDPFDMVPEGDTVLSSVRIRNICRYRDKDHGRNSFQQNSSQTDCQNVFSCGCNCRKKASVNGNR